MVLLALAMCACDRELSSDLLALDIDTYEPIEKFVPAYEAITRRDSLQQGRDYDLEKTVRIINALEVAQVRSKNFTEFLDYMARQDYSGVAPDVLEAKRKLFPVLEYTYKLQSQDEQLSDVWMLVRGAARGGQSLAKNTSASELLRIAHGDFFALMGIATSQDAKQSTDEAFKQYEKDKELKQKIRLDLQKLKTSYRQYLEDYTPIYRKYMEEYDRLCVEKDQTYLDLYAGRTDQALDHAGKILSRYPHNAEAMLLQSMAQIMLGPAAPYNLVVSVITEAPTSPDSVSSEVPLTPEAPAATAFPASPMLQKAFATLQDYKQRYPDRTAPALVLEGLLYQKVGDQATAISRFNQASIEYPRQAEQLTDMLDAYNTRNYLTKTSEGQYLRRLYASTMEGYGLFSPNLLKAKHYADKGDMEQSRKEIYNHFFRRGNQGIYDELLSDMQFCEENLYGPFKSLLLEQSYIDVELEPKSEWLFWNSSSVMNVKIHNRSDVDLENVRIFLCLHYTDMYKDEYDVVKVPRTASHIAPHSTADLDTLLLTYPGKTYDDITHIRAIAMTDDRICWVDDVDYKQNRLLSRLQQAVQKPQPSEKKLDYMKNYSLDPQKLQHTLQEGVTVLPPDDDPAVEKGWWQKVTGWFSASDNDLRIEVPRVMVMTDPLFSLGPIDGGEGRQPEENELYGTCIRLHFDYEPKYDEQLQLFIYSDIASYRVDITYRGKDSAVSVVRI